MTATGSHIHFYSLRGAQPPGEGFSLPRRAFTSIFAAQMLEVGGRGVPRPYSASPGELFLHISGFFHEIIAKLP